MEDRETADILADVSGKRRAAGLVVAFLPNCMISVKSVCEVEMK